MSRAPGRWSSLATVAAGPAGTVADHGLLERLARQNHVQTVPHAPPLRAYVADVLEHMVKKFLGWFHPPRLALPAATVLDVAARALAWLVLAGALLLLARSLLGAFRRRRRRAAVERIRPVGDPLPAGRPADPGYWWSRLREALAVGDLTTALEGLWFWTGYRLAGPSLDPSWTSAELLRRTRREDLGWAMARLDAWRFGPRPPGREEIEGLAKGLREAVP